MTDGPRAIAVADVTGDGWQDLIVAGTGRGTVTVIPSYGIEDGDQGQRFRAPRDYAVGGGPFDLAIGDLNRDGRLDIAVANADADTVTLLFNTGRGDFGTPVQLAVGGNPRGIGLGDFNRDGILDIAVTKFAGAGLDLLFGAGDGTFPSHRLHGAPANPQGITIGDFNHDGWTDVAVAAASGTIRVYEMFATGAVIRDLNPSSNGWNVIASADLDHDGRLDLAVASTGSSLVHLLYNRPSGWTFSPAITVSSSPRGIAIADLNQDGTPEVVTAGRAASTFTVIGRAADGSVSTSDFVSGSGSRALALADFENNGRIGVATANEFGKSVTVHLNATDFGPAPAFAFTPAAVPGWYGPIYAVADFNENGIPDFVADNRVILDGTTPQAIDSSNPYARSFSAADVNNDGHLDVLTTGQSSVIAYLGDGKGSFTAGPATPMSMRSFTFRPADMNRDGKIDILVSATDLQTTAALEVYVGRGDGGFTRRSSTPISTSSSVAAIADVDRDARQDAVLITQDGVLILLGDGAGGFTGSRAFNTGVRRSSVAVGDFTADGVPDLVTADMEQFPWGFGLSSKVTVARGVGDGTFETLHQYDVAPDGVYDIAWFVQLADLNADGALDIFTGNGHLLRGNNTGEFQAPDRFALFGTGLITDVNGDGLPDLVGFQSRSGSSAVFLNTRRAPSENRPPTGLSQFDEYRWNYATWWYAEDESGIFPGYLEDADMHALRYTWTMNGKVVGHYESWGPDAGTLPGRYDVTVTVDDYRGGSVSDSFTLIVEPFKETVLLPADDAQLHGAWRVEADPTASSYGRRVTHPNAGAPKLQTALANPTDYLEMGFIADPTQQYKLWIRMTAENDSWANDSVFVQFSGARDAAGNPVYEIGSTSALAVNLEECSGCGLSGWGWEDDGWGAVNLNGTKLYFPDGGPQVIRIQTREDGVSIDAVVLSAEKYATSRPGTAKNDTTKLSHAGPWISPDYVKR